MIVPPMPTHRWAFQAALYRVIDGDTVRLYIDHGFNLYRIANVRLLGINTPELRGAEHEAGLAARRFVTSWFARLPDVAWPVMIVTEQDPDSFGRYLAWIYAADTGERLNAAG